MEMLMKRQLRRIRLRNVIVFTEAIFGKKKLVFARLGGVRGGRQWMDVLSLCARALCVSAPVFMGHLKASKCAAVCGLQVLPKTSGRAANAGLELK